MNTLLLDANVLTVLHQPVDEITLAHTFPELTNHANFALSSTA